MKCPYVVNRYSVVCEKHEYDSYDKHTMSTRTEINTAEMVDCQKENCGAYQDGKCKYNATVY